MRSVWKGTMGLGILSVPVKLYGAKEKGGASFHLIHPPCGGRIRMQTFCPQCEASVDRGELKRGYEVAENQHIVLDEADFESLPLKTLKQIEIVGFVTDSLDPRLTEDTYYLSPEKGGEKAYQLLREVMGKLGVKAIGKLAYREREHLCTIMPYDSIFLVQTLCYSEELRPYEELRPKAVQLSEKELELGEMLVSQMMATFDHASFKDEYRAALERLIEAKIEGRAVVALTEEQAPAGDLVAQLLASVGLK